MCLGEARKTEYRINIQTLSQTRKGLAYRWTIDIIAYYNNVPEVFNYPVIYQDVLVADTYFATRKDAVEAAQKELKAHLKLS